MATQVHNINKACLSGDIKQWALCYTNTIEAFNKEGGPMIKRNNPRLQIHTIL